MVNDYMKVITNSNETEYAGWVLFRDESIDIFLRVAILQQVLGININKIILGMNFRPKQIEIDSNYLICGEESLKKLRGI
jgi:hypothetical protein